MTLYLQMNGSSDYLVTPSVSVNKIIMEMYIDTVQVSASFFYYFDLRPTNTTYFYGDVTGGNQGWLGSVTNAIVDGTTYTTGPTAAAAIPKGVKTTVEVNLSAVLTAPIRFFRKNDNTFATKGRIHRIRGYNGATLVFDYLMSTGTVNDQSGNGRNGTLSGGTWVDDGVGSGTTYSGSGTVQGTSNLSSTEHTQLKAVGTAQGYSDVLFVDKNEIVAQATLIGAQQLEVTLKGHQKLEISLQGKQRLDVNLKGVMK